MGSRYPGRSAFEGLAAAGATASDTADGQVLTAGATTRIATPWLPAAGAEVTFAKASTATGTLLARRSRGARPPDTSGATAIWTPSAAPSILLDPAAGTLASQGWVGTVDSESYDPVDGTRRIIRAGAWFPTKSGAGLIAQPIRRLQYRIRMGLRATSASGLAIDFAPPLASALLRLAWLGSDYGAQIGQWANGYGTPPHTAYKAVVGYLHDIEFLITTTDGATAGSYAEVRMRTAGVIGATPEYDFWSADGFRRIGATGAASYGPNTFSFGQAYTSTLTDVHLGHVAIWADATDGTMTVTDGATLPSLANADWVQVEGPQASGVVSLLGVYTGAAPAAPVAVTATPEADGIIRATVPLVAGTTAWRWTLKLAGTVVKTRWTDGPGIAFPDLADGSYTVECQEQGAAGPLSTATASTAVTLPVSDAYAAPTTPATPTAYAEPTPATPAWSEDVSNLILSEPAAPGTGQLPVTHIWLGYQPTPGAATVKLATGAGFTTGQVEASSVAESDVTWTDGEGVVTAFAALVTAIRALFPTALLCQGNDDGQVVTWSGGINPTAQGQYECTITGKVDKQWYSASRPKSVKVKLLDVGNGGDQTYLTREYEGVIGPDGIWAVTGLLRGVPAEFTFPDGSTAQLVLPTGATATYPTLDP